MDDQKKRASCDGGGGGTAGASMRCKTEATNEITPVPQKTTANDLKSPPSNLTVDGPPESDKSAGTLKDEPSSKSPSDNVKDVPPESDKSLSDVDTIFLSGIIAMADAARKLHPEETDKVNKLQELCANCVHNYNIKEGGLGGGGDGESGCGVVNNNKVCGQCGGRSYGGPHDNDLDPMDRVFNYHKYDPASYDPNSGVSVEVHSLQYACGKFAEIQYIGKIAPRYGETATENDKDWDKSYPFQGDPNAENPEPIQPFNANEITSDNIQNVADMLRGTVVVYEGTNDNIDRINRVDPQFLILGNHGKYYANVRAAMYLHRHPSGTYELIFPKGASIFKGPVDMNINNLVSTQGFTLDMNLNVTGWNTYMEFRTGITHADAMGKRITLLLTQDSRAGTETTLREVLSPDGNDTVEHIFITPHNANSNLTDNPTCPLRNPMTIHLLPDNTGLVIIGKKLDACGNVLFNGTSSRQSKKVYINYGNKGTRNSAGKTPKHASRITIWYNSESELRVSVNRLRVEFGFHPLQSTDSLTTSISTELPHRVLSDDEAKAMEKQVKRRVILCGGTLVKPSEYIQSKQKFHASMPIKLKHQQVDIKRANTKTVNGLANPATNFDLDSSDIQHVFNGDKICDVNVTGPTFISATTNANSRSIQPTTCKTSYTHSSPRNSQNGEMMHLSPHFIMAKFGEDHIRNTFTPGKWKAYNENKGRIHVMPAGEVSPAFLPRFLTKNAWEKSELYLHSGSGFESALFSLYHHDKSSGSRRTIHSNLINKESRKTFVHFVHHSDAANKFVQTGRSNTNGDISPGCERLATGYEAVPVYAIFELDWNVYYGAEHVTITKFFDRYNFCEPIVVDLNTFSAEMKFAFTEEENAYVYIQAEIPETN